MISTTSSGFLRLPANAMQLKNLRMMPSTRKTLVSAKAGTSSQMRCSSAEAQQHHFSASLQRKGRHIVADALQQRVSSHQSWPLDTASQLCSRADDRSAWSST